MRRIAAMISLVILLTLCTFASTGAVVTHDWNQGCLISVSCWATDSNGNTPNWDPHRADDNSTITGLYHNVGGNWQGDMYISGFFTVQPELAHPYPTFQYSWKIDYTSDTNDINFLQGVNLCTGSFNTNTGSQQQFSFAPSIVSHSDSGVSMGSIEGMTALLRFSLTCNNTPSCGTATASMTIIYTYTGSRPVNLTCKTKVNGNFVGIQDGGTCESTNEFQAELFYTASQWNIPTIGFSTDPTVGFGDLTAYFSSAGSYYERYDGFSDEDTFLVTGKVEDEYGYSVDTLQITAQ